MFSALKDFLSQAREDVEEEGKEVKLKFPFDALPSPHETQLLESKFLKEDGSSPSWDDSWLDKILRERSIMDQNVFTTVEIKKLWLMALKYIARDDPTYKAVTLDLVDVDASQNMANADMLTVLLSNVGLLKPAKLPNTQSCLLLSACFIAMDLQPDTS